MISEPNIQSVIHTTMPRSSGPPKRQRCTGRLKNKRYGAITTEIVDAPEFYFAEDYHQQYLEKNPHGYCGLGGTDVLPYRHRRQADAKARGTDCSENISPSHESWRPASAAWIDALRERADRAAIFSCAL